MNLTEAKAIVSQLRLHKDAAIIPYRAAITDFLIIPAGQKEFDALIMDIMSKHTPFEKAVQAYKDDLTIIVNFDAPIHKDGTSYCSYDYFVSHNNIQLQIENVLVS